MTGAWRPRDAVGVSLQCISYKNCGVFSLRKMASSGEINLTPDNNDAHTCHWDVVDMSSPASQGR